MAPLASPKSVKRIIEKYGFRFKKSLGQNFLIDHNIIANIVRSANVTDEDLVVEVGPGIGSLTEELANHAGAVLAVELDKQLIEILQENLSSHPNVTVIHNDILKTNLDELVAEYSGEQWGKGKRSYKVVANLPYYITTPVIMYLLESRFHISEIVIMIQKEVAERLVAAPGSKEYGAITLAINYYTEPEIVMRVPNTVFMPKPEVDSAVVRLKKRELPAVQVTDESILFKVIKASFGQRRKTLLNALNSGLGISKGELAQILEELAIASDRRGETLSLSEFAVLSERIGKVVLASKT